MSAPQAMVQGMCWKVGKVLPTVPCISSHQQSQIPPTLCSGWGTLPGIGLCSMLVLVVLVVLLLVTHMHRGRC